MPGCDVVAPLLVELDLNGLEQLAIENGRLLALEDFTFVFDFSNIEAVAQKISEGPSREWDASDSPAGGQRAGLGLDAAPAQIGKQQIEAAQREITAEDITYGAGFLLHDGDAAILGMVAERHDASDPESLALGGADLVPDPLGGDLALELGKRQQDIQGQSAHGGCRIELLSDRDERHLMGVE